MPFLFYSQTFTSSYLVPPSWRGGHHCFGSSFPDGDGFCLFAQRSIFLTIKRSKRQLWSAPHSLVRSSRLRRILTLRTSRHADRKWRRCFLFAERLQLWEEMMTKGRICDVNLTVLTNVSCCFLQSWCFDLSWLFQSRRPDFRRPAPKESTSTAG